MVAVAWGRPPSRRDRPCRGTPSPPSRPRACRPPPADRGSGTTLAPGWPGRNRPSRRRPAGPGAPTTCRPPPPTPDPPPIWRRPSPGPGGGGGPAGAGRGRDRDAGDRRPPAAPPPATPSRSSSSTTSPPDARRRRARRRRGAGQLHLDAASTPSLPGRGVGRFDALYNAALLGQPLATIRRWAGEFVLDEAEPDTVVARASRPRRADPQHLRGQQAGGRGRPSRPASTSSTPTPSSGPTTTLSGRARCSSAVARRSARRASCGGGVTDTVYERDKQFEGDGPVTLEDGTQGVATARPGRPGCSAAGHQPHLLGLRLRRHHREPDQPHRAAPPDERHQPRPAPAARAPIDGIRDAGVDDIVVVLPPHDLPVLAHQRRPPGHVPPAAPPTWSTSPRTRTSATIDLSAGPVGARRLYDPAHLSKQGTERLDPASWPPSSTS